MSELNADEFDNDYWFEMYQGQCAATDEWAKKYRDEVERKADATLLARCAELQRIAEVANAMVGKERDRSEAQAKRIAELEAQQYRCIRCMGWCSDNYCPDCGRGHVGKVARLEAQVKALEVDAAKQFQSGHAQGLEDAAAKVTELKSAKVLEDVAAAIRAMKGEANG